MINFISNLFQHKIKAKKVIWLIGIPYDYEHFISISNKSDYIKSLQNKYSTTDIEILWTFYEKDIALKIQDTINFLKKRNVNVSIFESLKDLEKATNYANIIVTAHRPIKNSSFLEVMGNLTPIDLLVKTIPTSYNGIIDLSSCYSASFIVKCKLQAPNANFIAVQAESSITLRLFLYEQTITYMARHHNKNYLDSLRIIAKRIVTNDIKHKDSDKNIYLGESLKKTNITFEPKINQNSQDILCSVYSPQEIKPESHLIVQVFIHSPKDNNYIKDLAKESDRNAIRRAYTPLQISPQKEDNIKIELTITCGQKCISNSSKTIAWRNALEKLSFGCYIPSNLKCSDIYCECNIFINGILVGDMLFNTQIVEIPRKIFGKILSRKFEKIFISYAHEDFERVKYIATAYDAQGIDYFFDKHSLKIGDIYKSKIFDYIDHADLFILCWSKNASSSDYVNLEKERALSRAIPKENARLKIYPISIEPSAPLPDDMKYIYNFGKL